MFTRLIAAALSAGCGATRSDSISQLNFRNTNHAPDGQIARQQADGEKDRDDSHVDRGITWTRIERAGKQNRGGNQRTGNSERQSNNHGPELTTEPGKSCERPQ